MDTEIKVCRSLPPLVEGKVHGSLKFLIDEVLWTKNDPGAVTVVASWWGEHDSAQFRLIDNTTDVTRTNKDASEIYDIKTNATLFEDYIKNCETVELVVIVEETHKVIGTAHIRELFKIFACKLYSQYVPILSDNGNKVGEIHVSLQLTYLAKLPNMQLKMYKSNKNQVNSHYLLSTIDNLQYLREMQLSPNKDIDIIKTNSVKPVKVDTFETYKSILKDKRPEFQESRKEFNEVAADKLVAQIVARAQRLRKAILKETYNEDPLALSDSSVNNESYPYASTENETRLYEWILENEKMTSTEEKKALNTLRLTSLTPSLIDLASKIITTCKYDNINTVRNENSLVKSNIPMEDVLYQETNYTESKGIHLLDHVDSIRIFIESFTLSSAGYRRAKSACSQYGTPLSLTYFVQYDITFGSTKKYDNTIRDIKSNKEIKFIRTYAKKQVDQVIHFNYEGVYDISRHIIKRNFPLKFKIFVRHCNKKSPTELGYGSMNINDIVHTTNLSSTQSITVINKGLKIGELKVTAELGCGHIHFGREFVDAAISAKENNPALEINHLTSTNNNKYKSVTGTHSSKSNSRVSPASAERIECLTSDNNKDLITSKNIAERRERGLDNKKIDTSNPETVIKDKVLLHGLIYIIEGKNLPELNTYLICRAFWREDKATSQICSNTKNPFYRFCQLIPLIHGTELLERIKDNYIIIEVYNRQNNSGTDNLLGIAKLPVHQLYVAYRDPLVLPHLLLSKYPVISVDGWVNINDVVSGKSCGELLALVALGTAEQIALLEVSRGLRNTSIITQFQICGSHQCRTSEDTMSGRENSQCNTELSNSPGQSVHDNNYTYSTPDQNMIVLDCKNQEIQTDISVLKDRRISEFPPQEDIVLCGSVDNSANACELHINKISIDQSAQTEIDRIEEQERDEEKIDREELCLNRQNSNVLSDDNDSCGPRNNFQLPTEMYRSVGVGAEYDEESDRQQSNIYNDHSSSSVTEENTEKDESSTNSNSTFFRAVVEIECALHLPKIERLNESVEPSTYVTFQNLTLNSTPSDQLNPYMITNIYPHNCNPKWNWRSDAKLPTELLLNNEKRLILKVWHLVNSDVTVINLEKDTVIGFAAVDLSVLMAGFPTISGWFHIIDFSGKCNGQIKISITPLDNLPLFGKFTSISATNLSGCTTNQDLPYANWSYPFNTSYSNAKTSNVQQTLSYANETECVQDDSKQDEFTCTANTAHNLENVSMSILSLSLKQKLNELNEITERLQSRLRDVTNTVFEDEYDSDFEINESNSENEFADKKNAETSGSATIATHPPEETLPTPKRYQTQNDQTDVISKKQTSPIENNDNLHFESMSHQSTTMNLIEATDAGYSSSSNTRSSQYPQHYQHQNPHDLKYNYLSDSSVEYPARGTKTHISHLLDKLSLDLPPRPLARMDMPMKKDIISLFTKLREHRNNLPDSKENSRSVNTCSVPTQTDNINAQYAYPDATSRAALDTADVCVDESISRPLEQSQSRNKISTVIREELVAEENDDAEWDELTTYLISTNIRCRNLDGIVNPLLYQHLIPDVQVTSAVSPEEEAMEQLDNRYATSFGTTMSRGANYSTEKNAVFPVDMQIRNRINSSESEENVELLCETASSVPRNVSNIDVSVAHKSSDDDLTSSNSTESTITASFDKLSTQQMDVETEDYCLAISKLSVPGVSRQAPDGGNPVEEVKTVATKQQDANDDDEIISDQFKLSDT